MVRSALSAVGLMALVVSCSSDPAGQRSHEEQSAEAAIESSAVATRATNAIASQGMEIVDALPPFRVGPSRPNGVAGELKWGSHVRSPREVQAPVGGGDGLIIMLGNSSFDVTVDGAVGRHLYVECQLQPNPRRDVRFESNVTSAGPSVGTMTFDEAKGLYCAVTPLVRPDQNRPMANFTISGPSADPAANIFLRSCTILAFRPRERAAEAEASIVSPTKKEGS